MNVVNIFIFEVQDATIFTILAPESGGIFEVEDVDHIDYVDHIIQIWNKLKVDQIMWSARCIFIFRDIVGSNARKKQLLWGVHM